MLNKLLVLLLSCIIICQQSCIAMPPLHEASWQGNTATVTALLADGANVNQSFAGSTPLGFAAVNGHEETCQVLLDHRAEVNPRDVCCSPLLAAAKHNHANIVLLLVQRDADVHNRLDVDARKDVDLTPLYFAVRQGDEQIARLLLKHGANPNQLCNCSYENHRGYCSLLHLAARDNLQEIAAALLEYGAHINAPDVHGATPMHWAVLNNTHEFVGLLLTHGANANLQDHDHKTPLHAAIEKKYQETIAVFADWRLRTNACKNACFAFYSGLNSTCTASPINPLDKPAVLAILKYVQPKDFQPNH